MSITASRAKRVLRDSFNMSRFHGHSGGPETARAAATVAQGLSLDQFGLYMAGDHHLGDLHAAGDAEHRVAVIDQDGFDLAAIIAVDGAGRIQTGDAVIE